MGKELLNYIEFKTGFIFPPVNIANVDFVVFVTQFNSICLK